jgi:glutathione S-transferase
MFRVIAVDGAAAPFTGRTRSLGVMEKHLKHHRYFAAGRYTIADIALYAYAHLAHECDFDLATFPAIRAWLDRVAAEPGYVPMHYQPAD